MIKDQARRGANVILALICLTFLVAGLVVADIRYGGPMFHKYALQDELVADILPPPMYEVEAYLEVSLMLTNPGETDAHARNLAQLEKDYRTRKDYWATSALNDDEAATLRDAVASADKFWDAVDNRFLPAAQSRNTAAMQQVHDAELAPAYKAQHEAILKLVGQSGAFVAHEHDRDSWIVGLMLALVAVLSAVVMGAVWWAGGAVRKRITDPLDATAKTMQIMAGGNYHVPIEALGRKDELGAMAQALEVFRDAAATNAVAEHDQRTVVEQLSFALRKLAAQDLEFHLREQFPPAYEELRSDYNSAVQALAAAMGTVRVGAGNVLNSIVEIRAATEDLAMRNEHQAASIEEISASMNTVSSSVQQSAQSARNSQAASAAAHREASEGGDVVARAVAAMAAIKQSSQEISQIVSVIDGIAFQTNLLALNAGVEAARAGDSGRGFAVVASEVRALAQRSADAAHNIKSLITNSTVQVDDGVALVDETGQKLRQIVTQVAQINVLISEIATSADSQARNLMQVNQSVTEMDRTTQQNAAMVEQSSAATRSLTQEAERLTELVASFRSRNRLTRDTNDAVGATRRRKSSLEGQPDRDGAQPSQERRRA